MECKFLAVQETCVIKEFILNVGLKEESQLEKRDILKQFYPRLQNKIEKWIANSDSGYNTCEIFSVNDRLYTNAGSNDETGTILVTLYVQVVKPVYIKIPYRITQKNIEITVRAQFKEIIDMTLQNFEGLRQFKDDLKKIQRFILPQIHGVEQELLNIKQPIEISYKISNNIVHLIRYQARSLFEYAKNRQKRAVNTTIILSALFPKNHVYDLIWDFDAEEWTIPPNALQIINSIAPSGKLIINHERQRNPRDQNTADERRLNKEKEALYEFMRNPNIPGKIPLHVFLLKKEAGQEDGGRKSAISIENEKDLQKLVDKVGLTPLYMQLDEEQKSAVVQHFTHSILTIQGEAGSGKSEVGAFIALLTTLLTEKTLISTETNEAILNFVNRMDKFLDGMNACKIAYPINLVRIHSKNARCPHELAKYDLEKVSNRICNEITKKCKNNNGTQEEQLKTKFKTVFTNPDVLSELISTSSDIVLSTFGSIAEKRFKKVHLSKFENNLVEASSGTNFARFALSGTYASNWIFLNDKEQLLPKLTQSFHLHQSLRFPDSDEIKNAKLYDPNQSSRRTHPSKKEDREYKEDINRLIQDKQESKVIAISLLKHQHRIHPELYKQISHAFNRECETLLQNTSNSFLDLHQLPFFKERLQRLLYFDCESRSIPKNLEDLLERFVSDLQRNTQLVCNQNRIVKIGIIAMNISVLRQILRIYLVLHPNENENMHDIPNFYTDQIGNISLTFSSIVNHQEKEYDLIFFGIEPAKWKGYRRSIYTSITRARSYAILVGPQISHSKKDSKNSSNQSNEMELIANLRREGH